jgi:CheY-like chemotaxis protein
MNILLVENSRTVRALLTQKISQAGYCITAVSSAAEAFEYLSTELVDLIILDVFMPSMNGYELAKNLRNSDAAYAKVHLLAYSSSQLAQDIQTCKEAGINDYLIKSTDHQQLLDYLQSYALAHNLTPPITTHK